MQEPERRSGCGSPLRAFSIIDCQKTCSPKACHQGIQLSYHIFRARRVRDRSCRCHSSCRACWTSCSRWACRPCWACRAGCSSRSCRAYRSGCSCRSRALPPDPALLSLQPDPPDLLLRLLLLDPALLPLQLGLPGLLLRLLRLDQSLLPDLALLSLPPGPAPLSDQSAPAHRHIQEIPADRSVPVALSAPGIPADLSAPSDLCSSSFHPAVRSFRRIPRPGIHFHSDFSPLYSRHHDKDHNPYFSYLNLLLLIFHEYSVTGYPFTILYAARPYSFLLSLSLHPRP